MNLDLNSYDAKKNNGYILLSMIPQANSEWNKTLRKNGKKKEKKIMKIPVTVKILALILPVEESISGSEKQNQL